MSGRGISKLGLPPEQYRVDLHFPDFETLKDVQREDALRRGREYKAKCEILGYEDPAWKEEDWEHPAFATYMREKRVNTCGAIWELIENSGVNNVAAFTLIPPTWEYRADDVSSAFNIRGEVLLNGLRYRLNSLGAAEAKGWIIAFIHGEHEPISNVFRLHVHGFACGGMIDVVNSLRGLPDYQTSRWKSDGTPNPVYRRVHISRKPLTDLPRAVSYVLQSYWPAKALLILEDGKRIRARQKSRIKEPYHSMVLAILSQHRLEDLTLMIGLRVTKDGLKQTKPVG